MNLFSLVSRARAKCAAKVPSVKNAPAFIDQMTVIQLIEMWPSGLLYKLLRIFEREVSEKMMGLLRDFFLVSIIAPL